MTKGFSNIYRLKSVLLLFLLAVSLLVSAPARADAGPGRCTGKFVNPITDICWSCLFPLSVGGLDIWPSSRPDPKNPTLPVCLCGLRPGIAMGFWEPVRLADVSMKPWCFVNLGGLKIDPGFDIGYRSISGPSAIGGASQYYSSWHVHWYAYPLIYWMEIVADFLCLEAGSVDILYISEIDPLWQDSELTAIINPEAVLFANPLALAACAPELHGVNLSTAERSKEHDNFGLAVAIFHLLAMGKHPYAGRHTGADLSLDEAIAQNRFAFSLKRKHETKTSPPPGSINLDDWPPPLSAAFEAAFGTEPKKRPDAAAWVALLKELETKLSRCSMVKTHYYPANAKSCVWCRLSSQSGVDMFPEDFNPDQTITNTGTFDIEKIWASISSVPLPDPQSFLPTVSGNNLTVSEAVSKAKSEQLTNKIISALMVAGAIGGLIYTSVWLIVWLALGLYGLVKFSDQTTDFTKFTKAFADADANARTAELAFLSRIGLTELYELHSNLERWTAEYRQLDDSLAREIMQLKSSREARQRADFLDRFPIRRAKINGLGPAKTATLASFGIETAADVTKRAVLNVPGFGESMTSKMLSWRKRHEAKFKYNRAPNASDLRAENAVRSASAVKRAQLALKISGGFSKYRMLQGQPKVRSSTQDTVLLSALERRDSAARDLKALGREVPNSEPIILTPEVKKTKSNRFPSRPTRSSSNSPSCPKCGAAMRRRTARRGVRAGNRFWGCSNYPSCRGTRN